MMKLTRICLTAAFMLFTIPLATAGSEVTVANGKLSGAFADGVHSFKGIPYAAPPLGNLRWRAPGAAADWGDVRAADTYSAVCQQLPYTKGSPYYSKLGEVSEDCLYLNVWSADLKAAKKAPVMVWIHGGSFTRGSGSNAAYDGASFARDGVVMVTINYRLNVFGYLTHPLLTQEQGGSSGNYGLLDQIAALQWVRDNIAAFGGDPDQVTVFGESAGSSAVNQLLASPLAAGLFQRAIGQSGGILSPQDELADGHVVGEEYMSTIGAKDLADLRGMAAEEVLGVFSNLDLQGKRIRPLVDGRVLPEQALHLFKRGDYNKVPSLVGYNKDESSAFALYPSVPFLFKNQEDFEQGLKDFVGLAAYPFIWAYPEVEGSQQPYLDFWRDLIFGWNMHAWARLNEEAGQPSWLYFFSHVPNTPVGEKLGAYHAAEIPYVFGNGVADDPADQRVHELVRAYWVNFASTGDPNGEGIPAWPRYGEDEEYLELAQSPQAGAELHWTQMKLWGLAYDR